MLSTDRKQFNVRLPAELRAFIVSEAERNGSSQNSEMIRCVRERADRVEKDRSAQS